MSQIIVHTAPDIVMRFRTAKIFPVCRLQGKYALQRQIKRGMEKSRVYDFPLVCAVAEPRTIFSVCWYHCLAPLAPLITEKMKCSRWPNMHAPGTHGTGDRILGERRHPPRELPLETSTSTRSSSMHATPPSTCPPYTSCRSLRSHCRLANALQGIVTRFPDAHLRPPLRPILYRALAAPTG